MHSALLLSERTDISRKEKEMKDIFYLIFAFFYLLELLVKLLGIGIKLFILEKHNILAGLIALMLITEENVFYFAELKISRESVGIIRILAITRLISIADQFTNLSVLLG